MDNFEDFISWAEKNPDKYAYCIEELKAFIARIERRITQPLLPLFDDLTASRISRAERLAPGDVTELSADARMAVLLAFAKKHPASEKYTPGPWQARPDNENPFSAWSVYGVSAWGSSEFICQTSGNCVANACLIAAAPKLLAALEAMVEMYGPRNGEIVFDGPVYDAAAAIAEAKGEL